MATFIGKIIGVLISSITVVLRLSQAIGYCSFESFVSASLLPCMLSLYDHALKIFIHMVELELHSLKFTSTYYIHLSV
jgi:hypothetical protein